MKETQASDAQALLNSIEQQKSLTAKNASMPLWLNVIIALLITFFVSFQYLSEHFTMHSYLREISLLNLFTILFAWHKVQVNRGLKVRLFPKNKVTFLGFSLGFLSGVFFDDLLFYADEYFGYVASFMVMAAFATMLVVFANKYPLSEPVKEVK